MQSLARLLGWRMFCSVLADAWSRSTSGLAKYVANAPKPGFLSRYQLLGRLLTYLTQHNWDVVTVDEALRRSGCEQDRSRYINFSIDDCYRDTFELVVPLFRRHGVPVTLFVATGIPDGTLTLWSAGLEEALRQQSSVQSVIRCSKSIRYNPVEWLTNV